MALDYVFGLPGNEVLQRLVDETADDIRTRRALEQKPVLRGYAETRYKAKAWKTERRVCARIEATTSGLDIRFVVTNLDNGSAEHIYDVIYCARGQAENLIKMHKSQLASDRTSCRSPIANQVRLVLHTAAYWLMLTLREAVPTNRSSQQSRVRHAAAQAPQARRPRHRNRLAHPPGLRRRLSRGQPVPRNRLSRCSPQHHERRGIEAPPNPTP